MGIKPTGSRDLISVRLAQMSGFHSSVAYALIFGLSGATNQDDNECDYRNWQTDC